MDNTKTIKNILIIFLIIVIFILMGAMSKILIPLFLALLFALIFQPLINWLRKYKVPTYIILPVVYIITLGGVYLVSGVVYNTVSDIISELPFLTDKFNQKFTGLLKWYNELTGSRIRSNNFFDQVLKNLDKNTIAGYAGSVASYLTSFTTDFVMFALYYFILLAGIPNYQNYMLYVGGDKGDHFLTNYETIQKTVVHYMIFKSMVNFVQALIIYGICVAFGIKFALFWGFLMFLMHFIPSVGSVIATVPPILLSMLQFDTWSPVILLAAILLFIQFTVGNIIEPRLMGKQLKINIVTVLFGLVFWGYMWGVIGMLMSVPLMVLIKLILEKIPDLSYISRLMGSPEKRVTSTYLKY